MIFVGLVPVILAAAEMPPKQAFKAGFLAGIVFSVGLLYWLIHVLTYYGGLPYFAALPLFLFMVMYLALYPGLFLMILAMARDHLGVTAGSIVWILLGAAVYCGLEYFKGFFLTGFPWEPLGGALAGSLPLVQFSDIVGTGGLTFLVVVVNMALAAAVRAGYGPAKRPSKLVVSLVLAVVVIVGLLVYGNLRLTEWERKIANAPTEKMAVAQGSIEQELKWEPEMRVKILMTYQDLTHQAARSDPWLTVWPETSLPFVFLKDPGVTSWMKDLVKETGGAILFGAPAYEEDADTTRYYNRAYVLDAQGEVTGHYDKVHLVPFGEYVPLKKILFFVNKITQAVGDYYPGKKGTSLPLDDQKIGVLICYESIFPDLAREAVKNGATILSIITNDAWFGRSAAAYQHFDQAILRAVENRRAVLRAANTGISGIILPDGRVTHRLGLFVPGVLNGPAPLIDETTFYTAAGDLIPQAGLAVAVVVMLAALYRRKYAARS
jgi:apolipoprotein N-acyltransferase